MKHLAAIALAGALTYLLAGVCIADTASNNWSLASATDVAAFSTGKGVLTVARVQLSDPCHEAQMQRYAHRSHVYAVYTRVRPEDVGKMCIQTISSQDVAYYEKGSVPQHVRIVGLDQRLTPIAVVIANTK
jgi:hypothetical protein